MGNWVDLVTVVVLAAAVVLEAKRGFGRAIFDLAAVLVAVRVAYLLVGPMSQTVKVSANPGTNEAVAFAVPFAILTVVLWILGKLVYDTTLISAEVFEPLLGGICGLFIGVTLAHAFVGTIFMSAGGEKLPALIEDSALGTEFLRFDTYHRIVQALYNFHRSE